MANFLDHISPVGYNLSIVFDGALVEDITAIFQQYQISAMPLFRKSTRYDLVLAGPWLVDAGAERTQQDDIIALAESYGDAVCWIGASSRDAIYLHLRQLNGARMPDDRLVYFRHYDPDVLASIVPLLDEEQAAKLFGPARIIAFIGGRSNHATVSRPHHLPTPPSGPIKFYDWQIHELDIRQSEQCRVRISQMLRKRLPNETSDLSDEVLNKEVLSYEHTAKKMGLSTELSFSRWAQLSLATKGSIVTKKEFVDFYNAGSFKENADDWLDKNFEKISRKYMSGNA